MSSDRFHIRPAAVADIAALRRLKDELLALENSAHVGNATEMDWRRDGFGPSAHFTCVVAEQDKTVIGVAIYSLRRFPGWNGIAAFLHDLYVQPRFRRQGVARALVAQVAADCLTCGVTFIELDVHAKNSARLFYARLGFEQVTDCATYVAPARALRALVESREMV
jgi:GNAT superfamily N-acetyltransferase